MKRRRFSHVILKVFTILVFGVIIISANTMSKNFDISRNSTSYKKLGEFSIHGEFMAFGDSDNNGLREIYNEDFTNNSVIGYEFNETSMIRFGPITDEYGIPWCTADFNDDGYQDLVTQTGDPGGGGNGYLDIWWGPSPYTTDHRQRFTFPNHKVYMFAEVVDLNCDGKPEILATHASVGAYQGWIVWIQYNQTIDKMEIIQNTFIEDKAPLGRKAVADFDNDGKMEFVIACCDLISCSSYFRIFEVDNNRFYFVGQIGIFDYPICAKEVDFDGDGSYELIVGWSPHYSPSHNGFYYALYLPCGNNSFTREMTVGGKWYVGINAMIATGDTDNDMKDEAMVYICPYIVFFEETNQGIKTVFSYTREPVHFSGIYIYDINGDGQNDLIVTDCKFKCSIATYNPRDITTNNPNILGFSTPHSLFDKAFCLILPQKHERRPLSKDNGKTWTYL